MPNKVLHINSIGDLERLAKLIASKLGIGDIIGLYGNMGVGKTEFTRQLLGVLGFSLSEFSSPTYAIQNTYFRDSTPISIVHHFDLYRITGEGYALVLESLRDRNSIAIVEWPQNDPELERDITLSLFISREESVISDSVREIRLQGNKSVVDELQSEYLKLAIQAK